MASGRPSSAAQIRGSSAPGSGASPGATAAARSVNRRTPERAPRRPGGGRAAADRAQGLAGDAERLAARGQHAQAGARAEQAAHEPRRLVDDVLAVVEDQQELPVGERGGQAVGRVRGRARRQDALSRAGRARPGPRAGPRSPIGARSTKQTSPAALAAASMASRVLPAPPGPRRVTSRASRRAAVSRPSSSSRPTKLVSGAGSAADGGAARRPAAPRGAPRRARPTGRRRVRRRAFGGSSSKAASASAGRPLPYRARMSWPRRRSRSGCSRRELAQLGDEPSRWPPAPARPRRGPRPRRARSSSSRAAPASGHRSTSASAGPRHRPSASRSELRALAGSAVSRARAVSRSNRWTSTAPGSTASRYPAPLNSTRPSGAPPSRSRRRSRETWDCRAFAAPSGGSSPYRPSISRSALTTRPAFEDEQGEQPAQLGAAEGDRGPVGTVGFDRPEDGELHADDSGPARASGSGGSPTRGGAAHDSFGTSEVPNESFATSEPLPASWARWAHAPPSATIGP